MIARMSNRLTFAALAAFAATAIPAQTPSPQKFPLTSAAGLHAPNTTIDAVTYRGRKFVRMTVSGNDGLGLALLPGTDFQDGAIEADIALKPLVPPGVRFPGFVGIAFRATPDASHYELFYVRPGNADAPDQLQRNHAVQYVSEPDFGWYRLRREWPAVYESNASLAFEKWTHVRIEVAGRTARLFVNGSDKPSLIVDGLKGENLRGSVGLWGYTNEEAYFSNVRITPASPQNVTSGSDATGAWEMRYSSDAGAMPATMQLQRDGNRLTGTWSGPLGTALPVAGTWRNGYVEISFAGEWPKEAPQGAPGAVRAFMAGWVEGDSAHGRMRVEGRSDGTWAAKRASTP